MTTTSDSQLQGAVPNIVEGGVNTAHSFRLLVIFQLATFQIGSAMGDILTAGVWNRIMISDFGIPAWPVGLLLALKNFMAPISLWVDLRLDEPLAGDPDLQLARWLGLELRHHHPGAYTGHQASADATDIQELRGQRQDACAEAGDGSHQR
jgi:hypothetical protein